MADTYNVLLKKMVADFGLEVVYAATDFEIVRLTVEDVARPGLQLAGYFDHFEPMRLQVIGNAEMSYLGKRTEQERRAIFDRLFSYKFPAMVFARDFAPDEQCLAMAKKPVVASANSAQQRPSIIFCSFL